MDPSSRRFFVRMAVGLAMAGIFWWILADLESCAKPGGGGSQESDPLDAVAAGMSQDEVRGVLGAPDMAYEDLQAPAGEVWETWDYSGLAPNMVSIRFVNGVVAEVYR